MTGKPRTHVLLLFGGKYLEKSTRAADGLPATFNSVRSTSCIAINLMSIKKCDHKLRSLAEPSDFWIIGFSSCRTFHLVCGGHAAGGFSNDSLLGRSGSQDRIAQSALDACKERQHAQ